MKSTRYFQKINAHLNAAKAYAELSYAKRLKVGAVIVREDRIISVGRNGTPAGRDNNCEWLVHPENPKVKRTLRRLTDTEVEEEIIRGWRLESKPEVCHAEANAILFAAKTGVQTDNCSIVMTHSPCYECAKMIVQCGIKEVFYEIEYRDTSPLDFLKQCNIRVEKING